MSSKVEQDRANNNNKDDSSPTSSTESDDSSSNNQPSPKGKSNNSNANNNNNASSNPQQQLQQGKKQGCFYPSSGSPKDPFATALLNTLPPNTPHVGIERARALRKQWLTQTRPLPQPREQPDFDELEEAFEDEVPFDPPVHLPNLLLMLLDIWEEEGLLN